MNRASPGGGKVCSAASREELKTRIAAAPVLPGVYCFLTHAKAQPGDQKIVYVGKAKNLRKRLQSYVRGNLTAKTAALMKVVTDIATTVTNNETEALLLEQNLIKQHRPRFNVLLRDDKSYPFLHLSSHTDFPHLMVRRGNQVTSGKLFGPYSSGLALRQTLKLLQTVFRIRQCSDDFFANRSRPCLQYQIGRCTAPCVGYISVEDYQRDVNMAIQSLHGKNDQVARTLQQQMDAAASELDYERAAMFRDKVIALRKVQERQDVTGQEGHADIIVALKRLSGICIHHMYVRFGKIVGNKSVFPGGRWLLDVEQGASGDTDEAQLLEQYISQHYLQGAFHPDMPRDLCLNHDLEHRHLIEKALEQQQGYKIRMISHVRGDKAAWLKLAEKNAEQALLSRLSNRRNQYARTLELARQLGLERTPARIECFDVSHTFGEETVASCVVFGAEGPSKSNYRLFNLRHITPGDDYAAMQQALTRRFGRTTEKNIPDLLLIDGGKGQVMMALQVLQEQELELMVVGIAKGPTRKAGLETLFIYQPGMPREASLLHQVHLKQDSIALHLIQHIRDESHRFALQHHRKRRARARKHSKLENIAGIGATKRRELLRYFGSLEGVSNASENDLARVKGISGVLARVIYRHFHSHG